MKLILFKQSPCTWYSILLLLLWDTLQKKIMRFFRCCCFFPSTLLVFAPVPTLQVNGFHPLGGGHVQLRKRKSIELLKRVVKTPMNQTFWKPSLIRAKLSESQRIFELQKAKPLETAEQRVLRIKLGGKNACWDKSTFPHKRSWSW